MDFFTNRVGENVSIENLLVLIVIKRAFREVKIEESVLPSSRKFGRAYTRREETRRQPGRNRRESWSIEARLIKTFVLIIFR